MGVRSSSTIACHLVLIILFYKINFEIRTKKQLKSKKWEKWKYWCFYKRSSHSSRTVRCLDFEFFSPAFDRLLWCQIWLNLRQFSKINLEKQFFGRLLGYSSTFYLISKIYLAKYVFMLVVLFMSPQYQWCFFKLNFFFKCYYRNTFHHTFRLYILLVKSSSFRKQRQNIEWLYIFLHRCYFRWSWFSKSMCYSLKSHSQWSFFPIEVWSQLTFSFSNSTIEALKKGVKYVQS